MAAIHTLIFREMGAFKTADGKFQTAEIQKMFSNEKMNNFAGKPKVFFIQACQGSAIQGGVEIVDDESDDEKAKEALVIDESDSVVTIPEEADILFAYATTQGYKAHRRKKVGSWFISECVDVFRQFRERCHLEDMLVTVRERVAFNWERKKRDGNENCKGKQMPYVKSTLTKRLYLKKSSY